MIYAMGGMVGKLCLVMMGSLIPDDRHGLVMMGRMSRRHVWLVGLMFVVSVRRLGHGECFLRESASNDSR